MNAFNVQNIIDGQAVGVSLTGMSIVFSGLLLISIYIALLPKILQFLTDFGKKKKIAESAPADAKKENSKSADSAPAGGTIAAVDESETNDIASVIGLVLQLEFDRLTNAENEQITITRNINQPSMWGTAGKMRRMPQRRTHA